METIRSDVAAWDPFGFPVEADERRGARASVLRKLGQCAEERGLAAGLAELTAYVSASHYLLLRHDAAPDDGLGAVVASDWPFDMVRGVSAALAGARIGDSLGLLQPSFSHLSDRIAVPAGIGRQYCAIAFEPGGVRMSLMLLFPEYFILSQSRLRDVGVMAGYLASLCCAGAVARQERETDLTEREVECLHWIAEGKTSDEVAVILGISRNTINNYITSVMRKSATKTRSEAIAWAVRNGLV